METVAPRVINGGLDLGRAHRRPVNRGGVLEGEPNQGGGRRVTETGVRGASQSPCWEGRPIGREDQDPPPPLFYQARPELNGPRAPPHPDGPGETFPRPPS